VQDPNKLNIVVGLVPEPGCTGGGVRGVSDQGGRGELGRVPSGRDRNGSWRRAIV